MYNAEYHRIYREKNAEAVKARKKAAYEKNKEKYLARIRNYRKTNKDKIKIWSKTYDDKRRATIHGRLSSNFRNSIYKSLKGDKKGAHWEHIIGYSLDDLKNYIEKQFLTGMSWENYGQWHVDHILPICSFDFSDHEEPSFKVCWNLNNLRPLWAHDNLKKAASDKKCKYAK